MRQTTLFGTPPNQAKCQSSSNSQNAKKNHRKSIEPKTSPRIALSDYFKNSININSSPENRPIKKTEVNKSPITSITDDISVVSLDQYPTEFVEKVIKDEPIDLTEIQTKTSDTPKILSNQITSHFMPKKVLDFDPENTKKDKISEDEQSLLKNKQKTKQKVEFMNGDILNIKKISTILMLTEFFSDFSDILEKNPKNAFKPPKFHTFHEAIQTDQPHQNFKILAPLLVRIVAFLFPENLPYFDKNLEDIPISETNASAILKLYLQQKNTSEKLQMLNDDFFCLSSEEKISILCLIVEELLTLTEFRTFYEDRVSNVDSLKRNLKLLNDDMSNFQREQMALKLYRTEKSQNQTLDDQLRNENDLDKENINHNANQHSTDEEIDTRLQRVMLCISNTQREITKVKNKIVKHQNICNSKKLIGTDSYGRNYYRLLSYSDRIILVEIDEQITTFLQTNTKDNESKNNESSNSDENSCENEAKKTVENSDVEPNNQNNLIPDDAKIGWMEFSKEEELQHLTRFLKADSCGKKFYHSVEDVVSLLKSDSPSLDEFHEDDELTQTHFLRSSSKTNSKGNIPFTLKGFTQKLLDFADDLFASSLVSTKLKFAGWTDSLLVEEETVNTSYQEVLNNLLELLTHLHPVCTSHLELEATFAYVGSSTPALSQLFLLLEFFDNNIDRSYSCYGLTCKKCYRRFCWDGVEYEPFIKCSKCLRAYHLTCQQPPLKDIRMGWECNKCDNPSSFAANSFYKSRGQISDDDESTDTELASERKRSLRPRKDPLVATNESSSSPEVHSKRDKRGRCYTLSSESDDQSPMNKRKGLHAFAFQPMEKKLRPKPNEYTSKLRSSCF